MLPVCSQPVPHGVSGVKHLTLVLCLVVAQWMALLPEVYGSGCINLNFQLDMPLGCFGAFEMTSNTAMINGIAASMKAACQASINNNNYLNTLKQPAMYGAAPIFDQILQWQGQCYSINLFPVYRPVFADIIDEINVPLMSQKADELCRSDATHPPQIITAIDGTFTNSVLFSAMALPCQAYQIPSIVSYYTESGYSVKTNYPLSARTIPNILFPNDILFYLLKQYSWTRIAMIISDTPTSMQPQISYMQAKAAKANVQMLTVSIPPLITDCSAYVQNIIDADYRVIYLLGTYEYLKVCTAELLVHRQLLPQNYIIIISLDLFATASFFQFNVLASVLNLDASRLRGLFALRQQTKITSMYAMFSQQMASLGQPLPVSPYLFPMAESPTFTNQGVVGMLGGRLGDTLGTMNRSAWASADPASSLMQSIQNVTNSFLASFSISGSINVSALQYFTADQMTFNITVPFSAIRYNTSNIFYYWTNASHTSYISTTAGAVVHDANGDLLMPVTLLNFDGANPQMLATLNPVYNDYQIVSQSVTWPNASILADYAYGIPTDRVPTNNIQLNCLSCASPLLPVPPSSTLFSNLPSTKAAYELTISQEAPAVFSIAPVCDGTAPVIISLLPLLDQLSSNTSTNTPVLQQPSTNTIIISSVSLVKTLKQFYDLSGGGAFATAGQLTAISSFSALQSINSPSEIVTVVNGGIGAFIVEFLINCNNQANNASVVLRLTIQGQADIFTPSTAAQDALIVLNGAGMASVLALIVLVTVKREERAIFSSSYFFLMIILLGFALLFLSALLTILPATQATCQLKMIAFHFGFTLALGSIFAKNYRLHRIFNSKNLVNLSITNAELMSIVLVLLVVDAIVISSWIQLSGFGIESATKPHCFTSDSGGTYFPAIFTGLKGFILFCGIYLTFQVRAVPANFNESKFIAFVIYNTAILSIVYIVVFFGFSLQPNSLSIFTSVILFLAALINLLLFYMPKLMALKSLNLLKSASDSSSLQSQRSHGIGRMKMVAGSAAGGAEGITELESKTQIAEQKVGSTGVKGDASKRLAQRLRGLKTKYLSSVNTAKRGEAELGRQQLRLQEVKRTLQVSYEKLQDYCMDIRLNCQRMKKATTNNTQSEDLLIVSELERIIDLPIDRIECDGHSDNYAVVDAKAAQRRKVSLNSGLAGQMLSNASALPATNDAGRSVLREHRKSLNSQSPSPVNAILTVALSAAANATAVAVVVDSENPAAPISPSNNSTYTAPLQGRLGSSSVSLPSRNYPSESLAQSSSVVPSMQTAPSSCSGITVSRSRV